ncbi:pentapeptide repeat-containing protein [Phormidesmis sp. 146-12]
MARYALVIGIDTNQAPMKSLSKTRGDAEAIANLLRQHGGFQEVKPLIGTVTQKQLEEAIQDLLHKQGTRSDVVIYYTGHGFPLSESFGQKRIYLAPSDCRVRVSSDGRVTHQELGIPLEGLNDLIRSADLGSLVLLLECCYSGSLLENRLVRETMTAFTKTDYFLIAACRDFEQAYARNSERHSIFTTALLKGLQEKNDRGQVTTGKLFDFIAGELQNSGQEPFYLGGGRSLTLVSYQPTVSAQVTIDETNPYQGLLAFTPATAKFFFGRDRVVQDLVAALARSNFVPLIGASGSGKSSVVRAGLIPRLEELGWRVLEPMTPGTEPLETLRSQISSLYVGDVIEPLVSQCRPSIPGDEPILLVVDQFEEIFTLCRDRAEQSEFINLLLNLPESGRIKAVITMRADFVEACLANVALTQAQTNAVWLGAISGADLEAAIVKPATIQGMTLQARLLAQILQDVKSEENCLPLLEFALQQLWNLRSHTELTVAAYQKLNGVTGALNAHAEEIYKQLAVRNQEEWAKRVLLRLVRTGEGTKDTRQRQAKADLLTMGKDAGEKEAITSVITTLVDGRLLVSNRIDQQDVIDLSHEALMLSWKRFVGWRESDRETRRLVDKIEDAKREWQAEGKRKYLLDGRLLKDAKRLLKDKPEAVLGAKAFIQKSLWWRRSQLAGLLLIPISVLGIPAEYFWWEAAVRQNYQQIERLGNGSSGETEAVIDLARGCWAHQPFLLVPQYFRERVFGNCRSLNNATLANASLTGENLSGAYLIGANLSGAYLIGANLSDANLSGANLSGAYLNDANLSGAYLSRANLSGANLSSANLSDASLSGANLSGAYLNDANLSSTHLVSANLSSTHLVSANLSGANLSIANLSGAKFGCFEFFDIINQQKIRQCPNLEDVRWDDKTTWRDIQGWETVENIPPALKKQLNLKNVK